VKLKLTIRVEQVRDGVEYKGLLTVGKHELGWHLRTAKPITEIEMAEDASVADFRQMFLLSVSRNGSGQIEMTDDDYVFVWNAVVPQVAEFCRNATVRAHNDGVGWVKLGLKGVGVPDGGSLGLSRVFEADLTAEGGVLNIINRLFGAEFAKTTV